MNDEHEKTTLDISVKAIAEKDNDTTFFSRLTIAKSPIVVMPDGIVYTKDYDREPGRFTDDTAEAYARQNGGIFIPAVHASDNPVTFKLADFIAISRILAKNTKQEKMKALAQDPETFDKLAVETKYLEWVKPVFGANGIGGYSICGFVGDVVGEENRNVWESFGPKENRYKITLKLLIDGFGYEHFSFSGKELSADIDTTWSYQGSGVPRTSEEISAVIMHVTELYEKAVAQGAVNTRFSLSRVDKDKPSTDVRLTMCEPSDRLSGNYSLEHPVRPTEEMLTEFCTIADKVSKVFKKLDDEAKAKQAAVTAGVTSLLED